MPPAGCAARERGPMEDRAALGGPSAQEKFRGFPAIRGTRAQSYAGVRSADQGSLYRFEHWTDSVGACLRHASVVGYGRLQRRPGKTDRTMPRLQQGRISKRTVDALPVGDKEAVFWDLELLGFGVRVYTSGAKVFIVQSRAGGKSRRYTIGRHGPISAEEARRKAKMTIATIKGGLEPELSPSGWVIGPPREKSGLSAIDGMPNSIHRNILTSLVRRHDRPVMNNTHRVEYVECLVAEFLGGDWTLPWTSGYDWVPWDIEHVSGTRIEIKQCAALPPWHAGNEIRTRYRSPQGLLGTRRRVDRRAGPVCRPLCLRLAWGREGVGRRSASALPMAVLRRSDAPSAGKAGQYGSTRPEEARG